MDEGVEMELSEDYLKNLNSKLRKGWTAHVGPEGRIYYMNHETKVSSWLPPVESWCHTDLPYGWEAALDTDGKCYYISHLNRTTTFDYPRKRGDEDSPPQSRCVVLVRHPDMGFGFVAGSEKPVIIRFVSEGGPNEPHLMAGDEILEINGEDVSNAVKEHVIDLIRSCKDTVNLQVCQPQTSNSNRKSALLTAAKKVKLRNNPSRVRFSEGVVIDGSPLYSPNAGDVPFLPNVLKVFLENGQTKSFKYDNTTTVQDVVNFLQIKLSITSMEHFGIVTEHIKISRRNKLTILNPSDTIAMIAARPGAHHLRCLFRVIYVPVDPYNLLLTDPVAFNYFFLQCCNDVVEERFNPELKYEIVFQLIALHMQQHSMDNGMQGKVTVKNIEKEYGVDRFVPPSLLDTMKPKELRKLIGQCLKLNPANGHYSLHYLHIISMQPCYGSKCFPTLLKGAEPEKNILVNPKYGVCQISSLRNTDFLPLFRIQDISMVRVKKEDEISCEVELHLDNINKQCFSMEEKDAEEFVLFIQGCYCVLTSKDLHVEIDVRKDVPLNTVPAFHSRHVVKEASWSYPPGERKAGLRVLDLTLPTPPYVSTAMNTLSRSRKASPSDVDALKADSILLADSPEIPKRLHHHRKIIDERHPNAEFGERLALELFEDKSGNIDVDICEAKNELVIEKIFKSEALDASPRSEDSPPDSPLRLLRPMMRRDSSFGLHSPDIPTSSSSIIIETLQQLREEEDMTMEDEAICDDPELIDLTGIPPPLIESRASLENHEDLSSLIIPPPPSGSPSVESQNQVIARFMAAAEGVKKLFLSDEAPESEMWAEKNSLNSDSSGYDTVTSSVASGSDDNDTTPEPPPQFAFSDDDKSKDDVWAASNGKKIGPVVPRKPESRKESQPCAIPS